MYDSSVENAVIIACAVGIIFAVILYALVKVGVVETPPPRSWWPTEHTHATYHTHDATYHTHAPPTTTQHTNHITEKHL